MPKVGKFAKAKGKFIKSSKDKLRAKKDEFVQNLKSDPFSCISAKDIVDFCEDPEGVIKNLANDPDLLPSLVSGALSLVPVVGPFLASVFDLFFPKPPEKEMVSKEDLEKRLDEFRIQMEGIMDKKIAESEVQTWKRLCEAFFKGLVDNMEVLRTKVGVLKVRLREGEADSNLKTYVREAFESLRAQVKGIIRFCGNHAMVDNVVPYYLDSLFIYIVVMANLNVCQKKRILIIF
ncbi:hypothetical protein DFA_10383 [Cavenderia fasciculata]|uniref:Pesticidal crystal protein domain-containing protein n=1 Tax=Cavenderia fasciculata TaxID=261658 RepID=F4QA22_CACFS|nr:uncharacterized protein DFA_10383 [Cavenderia fasciculata]EGG15541.1 hypothetical protein DFA_10383 [Cavenderia fasciculata]|eukprot:XP_004354283.1 hypothetical protein DFA_10383 [Cavenderia fasciculata]